MPTCEIMAELGDLYVLGVLEPDEADRLEKHVEECPPCRARLDADMAIAASLAVAPTQAQPPARLKANLLAAARGEEPAVVRPPWWRRLFPSPTRVAVGAASFASLAFVVALSWALTLQAQVAHPAAPIDGYVTRAAGKRLTGAGPAPDARGWLYLDPSGDSALLVAYQLPPLAPDRAYQLWLVSD